MVSLNIFKSFSEKTLIFVRLKFDLNNFSASMDTRRYFCSLLHISIQVLLTDNPKVDLCLPVIRLKSVTIPSVWFEVIVDGED